MALTPARCEGFVSTGGCWRSWDWPHFTCCPQLKTGYFAEDCYHSVTVAGRIALHRTDSLLGAIAQDVKGTLELGRFFPLTPTLFVTVFYLIRDVTTYKAYLIAVTVLDVVVFYYLVRRLSGNGRFACFAGCTTIALFQFRIFIDTRCWRSIGQVQLVFACLLLSLLALDIYLEEPRWGWLAASAGILSAVTWPTRSLCLVSLQLLLILRARREWPVRVKLACRSWASSAQFAPSRPSSSSALSFRSLRPQDELRARPFLLAMVQQPTAGCP